MWTDEGKLKILGQEITYYDIIESPAGPERIILVFPDGSELTLEWGMEVEGQNDMASEAKIAEITTKSEAHRIFCLLKKMVESCAEGKISRDVDL